MISSTGQQLLRAAKEGKANILYSHTHSLLKVEIFLGRVLMIFSSNSLFYSTSAQLDLIPVNKATNKLIARLFSQSPL